MANELHLQILGQGVEVWNQWREDHPYVQPDFSGADLNGISLRRANLGRANFNHANLSNAKMHNANLTRAELNEANLNQADLSGVNLSRAKLHGAKLHKTDLSWARLIGVNLTQSDLSSAKLIEANLNGANLNQADLSDAKLNGADLSRADLKGANLSHADLMRVNFVEADLTDANLSQCHIYGISAWQLKLDGAKQDNLIITDYGQPIVTVDNLEVAQFVYLILNNAKLRDVIDTIANKAVLILGRFTLPERKAILDGLRETLRAKGFVPIVFDFEKATERDFTETIKVLAGMSLFVIADVTNPRSTPLELQATVPDYMIPFVPIVQKGETPFAMFVDLQQKYSWVLDVRQYEDKQQLIDHLEAGIIKPALDKHNELLKLKSTRLKLVNLADFAHPSTIT